MRSTTSIARSTDRSWSDCLRDRLIVGALDGESWPHRLDENFTRVTSHEYLRRNRQFVHRTWDTLKEQCDVSYTSNKAYIPSTHRICCNCDLIEKTNWHISCRRVGECLSPLKSTAVSDRNSSSQQRIDNLEPLWPRWCTWMNCTPFFLN